MVGLVVVASLVVDYLLMKLRVRSPVRRTQLRANTLSRNWGGFSLNLKAITK